MSGGRSERVATTCARWCDVALARLVVEPRFVPRRPSARARALSEGLPLLEGLREVDWFPVPPALDPVRVTRGRYRAVQTKSIEWLLPRLEVERRLGVTPRTLGPAATLYGLEKNRVWILVHGWFGGRTVLDRLAWPFSRLLERYDILQVTLLGHGRRRTKHGKFGPSFPTRNPLANAIGLAIAATELRQAIAWLRQRGYERIGVAGTSIGAYVAALLGTTDGDIDRLLLDRVLVRMSEPLRRVAERRGSPYSELLTTLERIYAPVSPLSRVCRVPSERISMLVGQNDRIVGADGPQMLAQRWNVTPIWFAGSHALPAGRGAPLAGLLHQL